MGEATFAVSISTADGVPTYAGEATVSFAEDVTPNFAPDQGFIEKVVQVDLIPTVGGDAVSTVWPLQLWVSWGADWTSVGYGFGLEMCAAP